MVLAADNLLLFLGVLVSAMAVATKAADEDPLQDLCVADLSSQVKPNGYVCKANPKPEDFTFKGLRSKAMLDSAGFNATPASVLQFPGLNTNGMSGNRVTLAPGATNSLHIHPRATELLIVQAGIVEAGFVTTGNKLFSQILHPGDLFVIPKGLLHYQYNVGKVPAAVFASFNSQNPGTLRLPVGVFGSGLSTPLLQVTFGLDAKIIEQLKHRFAT